MKSEDKHYIIKTSPEKQDLIIEATHIILREGGIGEVEILSVTVEEFIKRFDRLIFKGERGPDGKFLESIFVKRTQERKE
jgi:hypothetical protein